MRTVTLGLFVLIALVHSQQLRCEEALRLHGSNTIGQKLVPALVREFAAERGYAIVSSERIAAEEIALTAQRGDGSRLRFEIAAHGTGTGYASLKSGHADLWMASRPVKAAELADSASLGALDSPAQEHVIGLDGLAVIVHPDNPVRQLEIAQVRAVFTGRIRDWSQLGGRAGPIHLHARDEKSGTFDTFSALVLQGEALDPATRRFESTEALASAVAIDSRAIGFVGLAGVGNARPLAVNDRGTRALSPDRLTVATEDYLLSRRLFLYHSRDAVPLAREFVEFAAGMRGQQVVQGVGFVAQLVAALPVVPRADVSQEYLDLTRDAQRISLNFRFGSGAALLDTKGLRDVERLAAFLRANGDDALDLVLIGFADGNETNPYQALSLSNERVDFVAQQLVLRDVGARRVRGMGHAARVAADDTPEGRARNRRVEAWVRARPQRAAGESGLARSRSGP